MRQEDLNKILESHKLWLDTGGVEGARANLSEANLSGAYLSGANLSEANLSEADLSEANLSRAYPHQSTGVAIVLFQLGRHYLQYNKDIDELRIGCQVHTLEHWLKHGEAIGKEAGYSAKDIFNYMTMIKTLSSFQ